jgi:hypothetical protein
MSSHYGFPGFVMAPSLLLLLINAHLVIERITTEMPTQSKNQCD